MRKLFNTETWSWFIRLKYFKKKNFLWKNKGTSAEMPMHYVSNKESWPISCLVDSGFINFLQKSPWEFTEFIPKSQIFCLTGEEHQEYFTIALANVNSGENWVKSTQDFSTLFPKLQLSENSLKKILLRYFR